MEKVCVCDYDEGMKIECRDKVRCLEWDWMGLGWRSMSDGWNEWID